MKKYIVLVLTLVLAGCVSCTKENEDFGPYPTPDSNGKSANHQSK